MAGFLPVGRGRTWKVWDFSGSIEQRLERMHQHLESNPEDRDCRWVTLWPVAGLREGCFRRPLAVSGAGVWPLGEAVQ